MMTIIDFGSSIGWPQLSHTGVSSLLLMAFASASAPRGCSVHRRAQDLQNAGHRGSALAPEDLRISSGGQTSVAPKSPLSLSCLGSEGLRACNHYRHEFSGT